MGRTVRDVQQLEGCTQLVTHYELDVVGNQLSSADPRLAEKGNKNFQTIYDLTQRALKTVSTDAGTHWTLHNVMGNPIYVKDSRNFEVTTEYDALHRPLEVRVKGGDGAVFLDNVVDRIVYGESVADAKNLNLRGQVYQHYDSAGRVQVEAYNINGQPLTSQRQLRQDYKQEVNWPVQNPDALLQATVYETETKYDAIGRAIEEIDADRNIHRPIYYLSGTLAQLQVTHAGETQPTTYVNSIDYNSKGQRTQIVYGNEVTTSYEYERTTLRLTRILTKRKDKTLQDLNYIYDPVGNITQIADNAWKTVFNNNQIVDPISRYTYDALYRLVEATGREHPTLSGQQERHSDVPEAGFVPLQNLNNAQAVENYIRRYSYDRAGNLYCIEHQGKTTRNLTVSEGSNRAVDSKLLNATPPQPTAPATDIDKFFDANGNQIKMQGIEQVQWNYRDNIASVTIIERKDTNSDAEYYVYDSSGSRIRKVTERYGNGGKVAHIDETIYLGGVEIRQTRRGETVTEERHCLRVMDDTTCIAVRDRWTQGEPPEGVKNPQVRYQLDNHLGSATMEVDNEGQLISYEEYFPYGGTAFVAGRSLAEVKLKHYHYSGKERDAATGLYYYGARYYAHWLGRWMSCDPAGTIDGLNLYAFVGGNPIIYIDKEGKNFEVRIEPRGSSKPGYHLKVLGRPSSFSQHTLAEIAKKYPNFHVNGQKKLKKGYSRNHILPWMTIAKELRTATRGFTPNEMEDYLRNKIDVNTFTQKNLKSQFMALTKQKNWNNQEIEKAFRLVIVDEYNNPNNLYIGNSSQNSSSGSKMKHLQIKLLKSWRDKKLKINRKNLMEEFEKNSLDIPSYLSANEKEEIELRFRNTWGRTNGKYININPSNLLSNSKKIKKRR